jgi:hypothetical protein
MYVFRSHWIQNIGNWIYAITTKLCTLKDWCSQLKIVCVCKSIFFLPSTPATSLT